MQGMRAFLITRFIIKSYLNFSAYSYSVEVSLGQEEWKKVVDYSLYQCQSWQDLYFEEEMVQYIRIVGTNSTPTKIVSLS
jgi:hypothetical protein